MWRLRRLMIGGLLAASLLLVGSLPAEAAARGNCKPRGSRAVFANRTVRVYRLGTRYFGCLYRVRRSVRLRAPAPSARGARPPRFQAFRTAGNFLAFVYNDFAVDSSGDNWTLSVESVNLRTGRLAHLATFTRTPGCFADPVPPNVSSLVLKSNGAVGWIQHSCTPDAAYAADRAGTRSLGDADARSLRLHGSTLTWTNGGIPESERLR